MRISFSSFVVTYMRAGGRVGRACVHVGGVCDVDFW